MPSLTIRTQASGLSDRGLRRPHNEDSLSVVPEMGLYLVADGMGGHRAGEVASRQAVSTIIEFMNICTQDQDFTWPLPIDPGLSDRENQISVAIKLANRDLLGLSQQHPEYQGMGTTVVGAIVSPENDEVTIAHVGDSRCYLLRDGVLERKTIDHSWAEEQVQLGLLSPEEAENHRWGHVITRALGNKVDIEVDVTTIPIQPNDVILLCTDGLSNKVKLPEMRDVLLSYPSLEECEAELIERAKKAGGEDNITLLLIRFLEE